MSNKRKKRPIIIEEGAPGWIVTYADFMSLLLCFFIMLFALSTLEPIKFIVAAESLTRQFGYRGASITELDLPGHSTTMLVRALGRAKRRDLLRGGAPVQAPVGENLQVQSPTRDEQPIVGGVIRFEPNSSHLDRAATDGLDSLIGQLIGTPTITEIRGHAGLNERGVNRNHWDLAYTRAHNVMEYLVQHGVPERSLRIISIGPHEPPSSNLMLPGEDPQRAAARVVIRKTNDLIANQEADAQDRANRFVP